MAGDKKQLWALLVFLLIPVIVVGGGMLVVAIDPEKLAGHANYARNFHLLQFGKSALMLGVLGTVVVAWFVTCLLLLAAKNRPLPWLLLGLLGPFGMAVLASLRDLSPEPAGLYERLLRKLNIFVRIAYEIGFFFLGWSVAWQMMIIKREGMIAYQSAITGLTRQQILDEQNASSGMWAFSELNEVVFCFALLYVLRPVLVNIVGGLFKPRATPAVA